MFIFSLCSNNYKRFMSRSCGQLLGCGQTVVVLFLTLAGLISNTVALISSTVAGLYVVSIVRRCGQLLGCGQTVVVLFLTLAGLISNTVALISSTVAGLYVVKKNHCSCCLFFEEKMCDIL